jgi:hypothetical protein
MTLALVEPTIIIDGLNQEYLDEWIAYRAEDLKKPMTPRAIKMMIRKLLKWSPAEQERLICLAIERNWQAVYWEEAAKQTSRHTTLESDLTDRSWAE